MHRNWTLCLLLCLHLPWSSSAAAATDRPGLALSALPADEELLRLLWAHSPELAFARARAEGARGELVKARRLPNPNADLAWSTIPLGTTNPPGLDGIADVPNYALSLSVLLELGKRGPRQRAARADLAASQLEALDLLRQRFFDLLERIGEIASSEIRIATLSELAVDARRLTEIQRQRASRGAAAGLDVDRSELEEEKLTAELGKDRDQLTGELLACAELLGVACEPFGDLGRAREFLARQAREPRPSPDEVEDRPDLRALEAREAAARASLDLARARAIPDPTVRAGYVYDRFVASGNQRHSLFVGLSIPLPLFEHGQGDAIAARAAAEAAAGARGTLREQARENLERLLAHARVVETRRVQLRERTLPLARGVVSRLDSAVIAGGAALQELLFARRTLGELGLEQVDLDLTALRLAVTVARLGGGERTRLADLIPDSWREPDGH